MNIKPLRTEIDYNEALQQVSTLIDHAPEPGSRQGDLLAVLAILIEDYESRHYPIDPPDPIEAIKFRMDQSGLTVTDLETMLGRRVSVQDILARRKPLTLATIRRLHTVLGIPADILIGRTAS